MNTETIPNLPETLRIARKAVYQAGNYLVQKLGQAKVETQKSSRDELLDADLEAENIILTILRKETPDIGILSEEAGFEGNRSQYWIIDPLDGSANFQHGNPTFAIAVALVVEQVTTGSIIYLPTSDELFFALLNQGAYLNKTPIRVSQTTRLDQAIVHIGDMMKEGNPRLTKDRVEEISQLLLRSRRVRMIGTAATDLAYVACGRADVLVNHSSAPWDREAGKLLLLEAGGKALTKLSRNNEKLSLYSNKFLHQEVENLLFSCYPS